MRVSSSLTTIGQNNKQMQQDDLKIGKIIAYVVIVLIVIVLLIGSIGTVGAGQEGVKTRFSAVVGNVGQGLYFKIPFIEHVHVIDIQTQKEQVDAEAASSDLQDVNATVAINFNVNSTQVGELYQNIGEDYGDKVVAPAIQEAVKAATAKYTAEELITKRPIVQSDIKKLLVERLAPQFISVSNVSIVNFKFSPSFNKAIEAKVTAEQDALAAKNKLEQVKFEAAQTVAKATADAQAIKIQAEAITQQGGHDYVQLQAINKWNGALPTQFVPGSAIPFLDLK